MKTYASIVAEDIMILSSGRFRRILLDWTYRSSFGPSSQPSYDRGTDFLSSPSSRSVYALLS